VNIKRTATRSCRIRKRALHFYSPGVVRRAAGVSTAVAAVSASALLLPPLLLVLLCIGNLMIKN